MLRNGTVGWSGGFLALDVEDVCGGDPAGDEGGPIQFESILPREEIKNAGVGSLGGRAEDLESQRTRAACSSRFVDGVGRRAVRI
jgi:hypothetical protein